MASRTLAHSKKEVAVKTNRSTGIRLSVLISLALAVFSLFSLLTYQATDASFFNVGRTKVLNACGPVGAYFSSLILEVFGASGYLIPVGFLMLAVSLFSGEGKAKKWMTLVGAAFAMQCLSVLVALQSQAWIGTQPLILSGGAVGLALSHFLLKHFNFLGAHIVSATGLAVSLLLIVPAVVFSSTLSVFRWSFKLAVSSVSILLATALSQILRVLEGVKLKMAQKPELVSQAPTEPEDLKVVIETKVTETFRDDFLDEKDEITIKDLKILPLSVTPEVGVSGGAAAKTRRGRFRSGPWKLPPLDFLRRAPKIESSFDRAKIQKNAELLAVKLQELEIEGTVTAVRPGPIITLYEFKPGPGVKLSRINGIADDLAMALSAKSVRILAPIPGKDVVGIEIPSDNREAVVLREFLQHADFTSSRYALPVVMGKDIGGQPCFSDLARMPHLLCAGQTGSGKSVFMNSLICSLLYRFTPDDLRLILVDPKFIEFSAYQDIPHLLLPVVDDPAQAGSALKWAVREMQRRYKILAKAGAKNLAGFNQKVEELGIDGITEILFAQAPQLDDDDVVQPTHHSGDDWLECFEQKENGDPKIQKLPNIVIIIDELADLMMVAKKEVELSIARIAQKARAAGIHLVIATQRPSTDVITGVIKANLPSRVSFQLATAIDSNTILGKAGAERLLGQGDMLFIPPGLSQLTRLHGAFLDDDEISKITAFLRAQGKPLYRNEILQSEEENEQTEKDETEDSVYQEAVYIAKNAGQISASYLQRQLKIGYNRAARIVETMEARGIVGPPDGARPREVLLR